MAVRTNQTQDRKQSLMSVLNNFVAAVDTMDDRVMIPSRLRDMETGSGRPKIETVEENNNMSVLPVSAGRGEDLYNYYVMLNAVKTELMSGKAISTNAEQEREGSEMDSDFSDSDDGVKDTARKTAEAFRHHLQGLFGLLNELTDSAKFLGDVYEDNVSVNKKAKKFAI